MVACHLELCPVCALQVEAVHDVAGMAPEDLADGAVALPRALREGAAERPYWAPRALAGETIGPWRWAGPKLRLAWLRRAAGIGECVYLLRAEAGARMPHHGHSGLEHLVVLEGRFSEGGRVFQRGDLVESGEEVEHQLTTDQGVGCICLVATEGPVRLRGLARVLQPLLGV